MKLLLMTLLLTLVGCSAPLDLEQARSVLEHGCKNNKGIDRAYIFESNPTTHISRVYCNDGAQFLFDQNWRGTND